MVQICGRGISITLQQSSLEVFVRADLQYEIISAFEMREKRITNPNTHNSRFTYSAEQRLVDSLVPAHPERRAVNETQARSLARQPFLDEQRQRKSRDVEPFEVTSVAHQQAAIIVHRSAIGCRL